MQGYLHTHRSLLLFQISMHYEQNMFCAITFFTSYFEIIPDLEKHFQINTKSLYLSQKLTSLHNTIKLSKPGNYHLFNSSTNLVTSLKFQQLSQPCPFSNPGSNQDHKLHLFRYHLVS